MNELSIINESVIDKEHIQIEKLLNEFYDSIDVVEETRKTYKKGIENFLKWVNDNDIKPIDKKALLNYKQYLIQNYETTTATTYLSGVRNFFNFLEELGIPNLMRNIKGVKVSREFKKQTLTKEQTNKILHNKEQNLNTLKDKRDYAIFNLLVHNGLRTIELERANKSDIQNVGGQFVLKIQGKGKTDKSQISVLTDSVLIPLWDYLNARGEDSFEPLFIGLSNRDYGSRLITRSIRRIIKNMLVANGYNSKELTAHSLRHTALTFALKGGATLQETKELGRHSDINTTLIYAHNIDRVENAPEYYVEKYLHNKPQKTANNEDKKED